MARRFFLAATALLLGLPASAAAPDAGASGDEVIVPVDRTTTLQIGPRLGYAPEQDAGFRARVPSYARALEMDRDQRWDEAVALYQQALVELAATVRTTTDANVERAADKIEIERRRSQVLAASGGDGGSGRGGVGVGVGGGAASRVGQSNGGRVTGGRIARGISSGAPLLSDRERGRVLRLKLMTVRAGLGVVPADLASATVRALDRALRPPRIPLPRAGMPGAAAPDEPHEDPEVRLLLCAARAATGDRPGARLELAHVARAARLEPQHALAFAVCAAALGRTDDAIGSLAVALYQVETTPQLTLLHLGQAREIYADSDWDQLRGDVRFERLFR